MGIPFAAGIQHLYDSTQQFVRSGLPVYLRVKNFQASGDYIEVGVPWAPTGGPESFYTGITDILIEPPPGVVEVSLHNIGLLAGRLNFGAKIFQVSNSFVEAQREQYKIRDPMAVWRERDGVYGVLGLFYSNRDYAIESITHKEVAGVTINWNLICNALEIESDNFGIPPGG